MLQVEVVLVDLFQIIRQVVVVELVVIVPLVLVPLLYEALL
jgi:hypothetical protein